MKHHEFSPSGHRFNGRDFDLNRKTYANQDAWRAEGATVWGQVEPGCECPNCRESRIDWLVWVDDEAVECSTCGLQYEPGGAVLVGPRVFYPGFELPETAVSRDALLRELS